MNHATLLRTISVVGIATGVLVASSPVAFGAAAAELSNIQTRANTDITTRLTSLTKLSTKVAAASHLTAAQKANLQADLSTQTTGLQALQTTIAGDTETATARTDFQDIFSEHYIYAFYLPRTDRIVVSDAQVDAATKLTTIATTLQTFITQAQAKGDDTTTLQSQLTEMQAKATAALTASQDAMTSLLSLNAAGYPGNKSTIQTNAATLATARTNLQTAKTDATSIVAALKSFFASAKTAATPAATE